MAIITGSNFIIKLLYRYRTPFNTPHCWDGNEVIESFQLSQLGLLSQSLSL